MDKMLGRQLKRLYGSLEKVPPELSELVEIVNQSYIDFQNEYKLAERSLEISSEELTELNQHLQEESEIIEKTVETRTKELNLEKVKLSKIAENMRTGAMLIDKFGKVIFLNQPARQFINFHEDHYKGSLEKLYSTFSGYPISEYVKRCIHNVSLGIDNIEINGSVFHILFQGMSGEDSAAGLVIWINDVTQEKILERSKTELVAIASHQLRTPLTVTKGNTEILLDESYGPLNKEQHDIIEQTHESNENMIDLVNQMLDITKIEQGEFSFSLSDVCVTDVLERVIKEMTPHAIEKNIQIEYNPPNSVTPNIKAEETRLYQVFQNLIDNAIKYSQTAKKQSVILISIKSTKNKLRISIKDEGIGIPIKDQSHLFRRFYRASNAEMSFIDGTGLGLHVVQSIVRSFNGKIHFTSEENKGTIFTVELPIIKDN
jgi:signal transduction histidine kinase